MPLHVLLQRGGNCLGGFGLALGIPGESHGAGGAFLWGAMWNATPLLFPHLSPPQNKVLPGTKNGRISGQAGSLVFCDCHMLSTLNPLPVCGGCISRAWHCRYPCAPHWFPASPRSPRPLPFARGLCGLLPCPGLLILTVPGCPGSPPHPLSPQLGGQTWEQAAFENISSSGPSKDCQLSARRNPSLPPQQISQGCAICRALG